MNDLDDLKKSFREKLDRQRSEKSGQLEIDLAAVRASVLRRVRPALPPDFIARLRARGRQLHERIRPPELAEFPSSPDLAAIDRAFIRIFGLSAVLPVDKLNYPVVYTETLEAFFAPLVAQRDLSAAGRREMLKAMVSEANTRSEGGGIFGFNLPGTGAFVNGWLFAALQGTDPKSALQDPAVFPEILETAIHEKLGHGFITLFTALGAVKAELGLLQFEIARRFDMRTADAPMDRLALARHNLMFVISRFLEEGWATWIETFLSRALLGKGAHPKHRLGALVDAVENLPHGEGRADAVQSLLASLGALFSEEPLPIEILHQALLALGGYGERLESFFAHRLGQPLPYALGELLAAQAEVNLGYHNLPYAVIIAGNVRFDDQIGPLDTENLIQLDPRLSPNARFAALSQLQLEEPGSLAELVHRAKEQLSLSVPVELLKVGG